MESLGTRTARFANRLSALGNAGSYRISLSHRDWTIDQPTLNHLADETRHALFFKRRAERQSGRPLNYVPVDMLAANVAHQYLQRLESMGDAKRLSHASR